MNRNRITVVVSFVVLLAGLLVMAWAAPAARATATITVQSAADDGTVNVAHCPGANCRLRDAIAAANSGDTITFAGDYTIALASTLTLDKDVTINGTGHTVAISGNITGDADIYNNVRAFTVNSGVTVVLQNLTIMEGFAAAGGGIYNSGALTVDHVTFTNNQVVYWGGGGERGGGAIYNKSDLTVTDCAFTGNQASGVASAGAIANAPGSTVEITGSAFDSNMGYGGGALTNAGTMTVENSSFTDNYVPAGYVGGGAIWNPSGNLTVTDSSFSGNTVTGGGSYSGYGGAILSYAVMTVTGNTFDNNSAYGYGGVIAALTSDSVPSSVSTLTNNTFSENSAKLYNSAAGIGGAVYVSANSHPLTFTAANNTFAANTAESASGGNLYFEQVNQVSGGSLTANLYNNILVKGATGGNCVFYGDVSTPVPTASHNLADDATCGTGFTNSSSIALGAMGNYGGSTQTIPLQAASAAIDAASPAHCPETDQRGLSRNDLHCDAGAYEMRYADSPTVIRSVSSTTTTTFGSALIGIQRHATIDPGIITVTKSLTWKTKPDNAIKAYWYITPTVDSGLNLTLTLCFTPTESNSLAFNALRFWRFSGGTWQAVPGTPVTSTVGSNSCATLAGINTLSVWTLATAQPTAVMLERVAASANSIGLAWPIGWGLLAAVLLISGGAAAWLLRSGRVQRN